MPTTDDLTRMYDRSYFESGGDWVCGFWSGSYAENAANLRQEAIQALKDIDLLQLTGWSLLEIGCAGGYFLDEARQQGYDVAGIELNPEMATFARERLELDVTACSIETAEIAPGSCHLVVMQDVLEHIVDPVAALARVVRWLAPGGILYIRGPLEQDARVAIYRAARTLLRRGDRVNTTPPFHVQGFTKQSFRALMERVGLTSEAFHPGAHLPQSGGWLSALERTAYLVDLVRGGGNFMWATARRA